MKRISLKSQLIIFLTCFALFLAVVDKDIIFLAALAVSVISAVTAESIIVYLKDRKFSINESPVITGLIIGYLLSSDTALWIIILAPVIAILSKHILRFRNRHIFNPAALGVFSSTLAFQASTQWKGTYLWYILAPFGLYFIHKIRKMELLAAYLAASFLLFGIQAALQKIPIVNVFGFFSYFYIFIMLIEPKTTPVKKLPKILFGVGVAILAFILNNAGVKFDTELCALLILNLFVPLFNKIP